MKKSVIDTHQNKILYIKKIILTEREEDFMNSTALRLKELVATNKDKIEFVRIDHPNSGKWNFRKQESDERLAVFEEEKFVASDSNAWAVSVPYDWFHGEVKQETNGFSCDIRVDGYLGFVHIGVEKS